MGTDNFAGPGEVGGPILNRIDYVNRLFDGGYALHFRGWLRRTIAASRH